MRYEAEAGDFVMAFTGESLICRKLSVFKEKKFLELRDLLRPKRQDKRSFPVAASISAWGGLTLRLQ